MKVRCIEDYEYNEYNPGTDIAERNRIYDTLDKGTHKVVVDNFGRVIMSFRHCCFKDYFKVIGGKN